MFFSLFIVIYKAHIPGTKPFLFAFSNYKWQWLNQEVSVHDSLFRLEITVLLWVDILLVSCYCIIVVINNERKCEYIDCVCCKPWVSTNITEKLSWKSVCNFMYTKVTSTPGNFLSVLDFDADVHLTRLVYFADVHFTRLVYFEDVHSTFWVRKFGVQHVQT